MKPRTITAALALAAACSSTRIHTDHDPNAPFGNYRTYALAEGQFTVPGVLSDHSLIRDRIVGALSRELAGKGLRHDPSDPDLIVIYRARARAWEQYLADWNRSRGRRVYRHTRSAGGIIVEFMDADTKALVWRGTAMAAKERFRSGQFIDETVHKLIARYPSHSPAG